ncbi:MAG: flavin reductase family protein [Candidatus Brockarchaeota archaeon]|nr:flavin reductase family protein [Candidatus Brockarchaeota archaeon]
MKVSFPPRLEFHFPCPIVLVTCGDMGRKNIIAVGAISHACVDPPMLGVAIGHSRHSYKLMEASDGFVVNVPRRNQVKVVDYCGKVSGENRDKFAACKLTATKSQKISAPQILEFPINIECATRKRVNLGSHDFFFGEIVAVHVDESVLDGEGRIDKAKLDPMAAFRESYFSLGDAVCSFGSAGAP